MKNIISAILISGGVTFCIATPLLYAGTKILEKTNLSTTADIGKKKDKTKRKSAKRCWKQALIYKDFLFNGGKKMIIFKLLAYPLAAILLYRYLNNSSALMSQKVLPIINILFYIAFLAELLVHTSMAFVYETKDKQMSSLLMLPLSNMEILIKKYKAALLLSLIPLCYALLITACNPHYFLEATKLLYEPPTYMIVSIYLTILFTIAHSNLLKTMKKTASSQIKNTIAMFAFYFLGIKPLEYIYDCKPWICTFIVAILTLAYTWYKIKKIDRDMTLVAQQEN